MSAGEQFAVWLFGIFCTAVSVCSVAKQLAAGRSQVAAAQARAHVEGLRMVAEAQHGTVIVPPAWTVTGTEEEL